jgi:hypothetical protein
MEMTYLKIVTRFGFLGDKTTFHNWEFKRKKNETEIRQNVMIMEIQRNRGLKGRRQ